MCPPCLLNTILLVALRLAYHDTLLFNHTDPQQSMSRFPTRSIRDWSGFRPVFPTTMPLLQHVGFEYFDHHVEYSFLPF